MRMEALPQLDHRGGDKADHKQPDEVKAWRSQMQGKNQCRKAKQMMQLVLLIKYLWYRVRLQASEQDDRHDDNKR